MDVSNINLLDFCMCTANRDEAERDFPGIHDRIETYLLDTLGCTQADYINATVESFAYYSHNEPDKLQRIINVLIMYGRFFKLENPARSTQCRPLESITQFIEYVLTDPIAETEDELAFMMRQIRE